MRLDTELKYLGDCEHLFCDDIQHKDCLKRYFDVEDVTNGKTTRIAICSDYIRLLYYKKFKEKNNHDFTYSQQSRKYMIEEVIEDLIKKELPYTNYNYAGNCSVSNFLDIRVSRMVCERIYLYTSFSLKEALEFYLNGNYYLLGEIKYQIRNFINKNHKYKKHKSIIERLNKIINKLDTGMVNELLVLILELKTK